MQILWRLERVFSFAVLNINIITFVHLFHPRARGSSSHLNDRWRHFAIAFLWFPFLRHKSQLTSSPKYIWMDFRPHLQTNCDLSCRFHVEYKVIEIHLIFFLVYHKQNCPFDYYSSGHGWGSVLSLLSYLWPDLLTICKTTWKWSSCVYNVI